MASEENEASLQTAWEQELAPTPEMAGMLFSPLTLGKIVFTFQGLKIILVFLSLGACLL